MHLYTPTTTPNEGTRFWKAKTTSVTAAPIMAAIVLWRTCMHGIHMHMYVSVCVCVCKYTYMCTSTYKNAGIRICTHTWDSRTNHGWHRSGNIRIEYTRIKVLVCMHTIYACIQCMHACIHVHMHVYMNKEMHPCMNARMHACMHVYANKDVNCVMAKLNKAHMASKTYSSKYIAPWMHMCICAAYHMCICAAYCHD